VVFLFLFQTLKLFEGRWKYLAASCCRAGDAGFCWFVHRPQHDGKGFKRTSPSPSPAWPCRMTGLTVTAIATTPKPDVITIDYSGPTDWMELTAVEMGYRLLRKRIASYATRLGKENRKWAGSGWLVDPPVGGLDDRHSSVLAMVPGRRCRPSG